MENLNGKIVVITGGCGQVGYRTAKRLSQQGATVIGLVRRDLDKAQELYKDIGTVLLASTTDTMQLKDAVSYVANTFGRCDILINAAGITKSIPPTHLHMLTDSMFDEIVSTNLRGTYATIREFSSLFGDNSLVINISSTSGLRASQSNLAYGAAKAGIDLITKTLGKAMAPKTRVVGIAPGFLENPTSGAIKLPGANERIAHISPMKRVGQADDIVDAIESVISMKMITGQTIVVDGGITL